MKKIENEFELKQAFDSGDIVLVEQDSLYYLEPEVKFDNSLNPTYYFNARRRYSNQLNGYTLLRKVTNNDYIEFFTGKEIHLLSDKFTKTNNSIDDEYELAFTNAEAFKDNVSSLQESKIYVSKSDIKQISKSDLSFYISLEDLQNPNTKSSLNSRFEEVNKGFETKSNLLASYIAFYPKIKEMYDKLISSKAYVTSSLELKKMVPVTKGTEYKYQFELVPMTDKNEKVYHVILIPFIGNLMLDYFTSTKVLKTQNLSNADFKLINKEITSDEEFARNREIMLDAYLLTNNKLIKLSAIPTNIVFNLLYESLLNEPAYERKMNSEVLRLSKQTKELINRKFSDANDKGKREEKENNILLDWDIKLSKDLK